MIRKCEKGGWGDNALSWPGLTRPSVAAEPGKDVDARHKAGHDEK
jgi:hypothetical protein